MLVVAKRRGAVAQLRVGERERFEGLGVRRVVVDDALQVGGRIAPRLVEHVRAATQIVRPAALGVQRQGRVAVGDRVHGLFRREVVAAERERTEVLDALTELPHDLGARLLVGVVVRHRERLHREFVPAPGFDEGDVDFNASGGRDRCPGHDEGRIHLPPELPPVDRGHRSLVEIEIVDPIAGIIAFDRDVAGEDPERIPDFLGDALPETAVDRLGRRDRRDQDQQVARLRFERPRRRRKGEDGDPGRHPRENVPRASHRVPRTVRATDSARITGPCDTPKPASLRNKGIKVD